MYMDEASRRACDKLYVFSRGEILNGDPEIARKYAFIPLPGPEDLPRTPDTGREAYIFAGGGITRDFATLIQAVQDTEVRLVIATFSPQSLGYSDPLPANVSVHWNAPRPRFLELMAGAQFVVVPLKEGTNPHGHTTVVEALALGKAVVSTLNASIDDYLTHGKEGLLVPPGDVAAYRQAILELSSNAEFRQACEANVALRAPELTYRAFAQRLVELCAQAMGET